MNDAYREFIIKTILFLEETSGNLFAQILNLSSHNELPLLRENFENGEVFNFNIDLFDDSNDKNVIKLVSLYKKIEKERLNLIKLNKISEDEIDHFFASSDVDFSDFGDDIDDKPDLFGDLPMFLN